MNAYTLTLIIPADEYYAHYQGRATEVVATDDGGRTVRFPSHILRPYVTHQGISGRFCIEFDENHRFKGITRLN